MSQQQKISSFNSEKQHFISVFRQDDDTGPATTWALPRWDSPPRSSDREASEIREKILRL